MKRHNDRIKIVEDRLDTYFVPAPKETVTTIQFDLEGQRIDVCCRRNPDRSCELEIVSSGEISIVPVDRETVYIKPI